MAIGAIITISIILASALTVGILVARSIGKKSSTLRGASLHLWPSCDEAKFFYSAYKMLACWNLVNVKDGLVKWCS